MAKDGSAIFSRKRLQTEKKTSDVDRCCFDMFRLVQIDGDIATPGISW